MASERTALRDYAIIVLLVMNLGVSAYAAFWNQKASQASAGNGSSVEQGASKTSDISEQEALNLADQVISIYNTKDTSGLYSRFDSLAKSQLTQEELSSQLSKLYPLMGTLSSPGYVGSELAGKESGRNFYHMNYKVRLTGGVFTRGDMRLTVTRRDNGLSLVSFFINGTDQAEQK